MNVLTSAVIHKLEKAHGTPATVQEAFACLDVEDQALKDLIEQVHAVYAARESKSYGQFDPDLTAVSAEQHLQVLKAGPAADFLTLSKSIMLVLKDKVETQNFSTGGHVLMSEFCSGTTRWFLVVILNNKNGTMITEDLRVCRSPHLDVEGIRFAGRVNLTDWDSGSERYISFLRGKSTEVSLYFQKFLGCSTVQKDIEDTRGLARVIKKFAADKDLSEEARERLIKEVHDCAYQLAKSKEPISLSTLANRVWPSNPEELKAAFAASDPPIADGFIPRARGLDGLKKFQAKTPSWRIEFYREAIQDNTITFNEAEGTLTITNLPLEIVGKLKAEFYGHNEASMDLTPGSVAEEAAV